MQVRNMRIALCLTYDRGTIEVSNYIHIVYDILRNAHKLWFSVFLPFVWAILELSLLLGWALSLLESIHALPA